MASVRRLDPKDGKSPWVVEYTDAAGKRRRITPKPNSKRDAEAAKQQIERDIHGGHHVAARDTVKFAAAAEEFLKDCHRRWKIRDRMCGNTYHNYRRAVENMLRPQFGALRLNEITSPRVQIYVDELSSKYKRGTLVHIFNVLTYVFKFSVRRGWLKINPLLVNPVRLPVARKEEISIPSRAEVNQIFDYLMRPKPQFEKKIPRALRLVAVTIAIFSGLRRGEICGLLWENIDFDKGLIHVKHSYSSYDRLKEPKSPSGYRSVPMAEPISALLSAWRRQLGDPVQGAVLAHKQTFLDPKSLTIWIWKMIRDIGLVDNAGRNKYSMHTLRHACVSMLLSSGLQPIHIKKMVGHSSIVTTLDTYGHLLPEDDRTRTAIDDMAQPYSLVTGRLVIEANATKTRRLTAKSL